MLNCKSLSECGFLVNNCTWGLLGDSVMVWVCLGGLGVFVYQSSWVPG